MVVVADSDVETDTADEVIGRIIRAYGREIRDGLPPYEAFIRVSSQFNAVVEDDGVTVTLTVPTK